MPKTINKHLPTDSLRSFVTVADMGSFTQAALQLSRTQPAITLQIQKLESMLGHTLFQRDNSGMALTSAGERLLGYAKRILALHDELYASFDDQRLSGKLRFGIPSEFATTLLPSIISTFANDHPNVTLDVTCDLSTHLIDGVKRHHYDLILALHNDTHEAENDLIKQEQLVWVSRDKAKLDMKQAIPLIAAPEGCIYRQRGTDVLRQHNLDWRIVYTIPDLSGIQAAIEAGLGITVLAKNTVPKNLHILSAKTYGLPDLGKIGISLISKNRSQAVQKLIQYIQHNI